MKRPKMYRLNTGFFCYRHRKFEHLLPFNMMKEKRGNVMAHWQIAIIVLLLGATSSSAGNFLKNGNSINCYANKCQERKDKIPDDHFGHKGDGWEYFIVPAGKDSWILGDVRFSFGSIVDVCVTFAAYDLDRQLPVKVDLWSNINGTSKDHVDKKPNGRFFLKDSSGRSSLRTWQQSNDIVVFLKGHRGSSNVCL